MQEIRGAKFPGSPGLLLFGCSPVVRFGSLRLLYVKAEYKEMPSGQRSGQDCKW